MTASFSISKFMKTHCPQFTITSPAQHDLDHRAVCWEHNREIQSNQLPAIEYIYDNSVFDNAAKQLRAIAPSAPPRSATCLDSPPVEVTPTSHVAAAVAKLRWQPISATATTRPSSVWGRECFRTVRQLHQRPYRTTGDPVRPDSIC